MGTFCRGRDFHCLPSGGNFFRARGILTGLVLVCAGISCCASTESAKMNLEAVLHSRYVSGSYVDSGQITNAIQAFGTNRAAAFPVLVEASDERNNVVVSRALFLMGQLGKSVSEVQPFLWAVVRSPSRSVIDRAAAFQSLQKIGFEPRDIPTLAQLLSGSACDHNVLTLLVPEAISGLIEVNPSAAKPYLSLVENLLEDSNPDTQFRAALALIKSEGAGNPRIFSALHTLFQRPNDNKSEYYKMLAAQALAKAGPSAKPLVPDLLQFAKLPDEGDVYQDIAQIAPRLGSKIPEVAQVLKEQQRERMWEKKWKSGLYTMDDLRAALKDPNQTLTAAQLLSEKGAVAKTAVPEMIRAMWGKDEYTRNKILADIHKIDPQVTVTKIELFKGNQGEPVNTALNSAYSALQKMPSSPQIKTLKNTCFQMFFPTSWILPDELAALTNSLAEQAPKAYEAYLDGLKPPVCVKPTDSNTVLSPWEKQSNLKIK